MRLRSNEPFWLVKNGMPYSYPSIRQDAQADVLIVGGGITGSLIAHKCVEDGYKTILVDRREIGHGSTSATTSMLQYEIDTPLYKLIEMIGENAAVECYRACDRAIDDLEKIARTVRSKSGFAKKRSLYYAALKKHVSWLREEFRTRSEHGFRVNWLEAEQIAERYGLENTHGAILSEQGGSVDAFQLAHDILAYNFKRGLRIFDKTEIVETDHKRTGVTAVTEYGTKIKARQIIYCNGFESNEIIKEKFVDLLSTYAIVGERQMEDRTELMDMLFWSTSDPYLYMRTTDDGRLLIGGEDEDFLNAEKRDSLIPKKAEKLERSIKKLLPGYDFRTDFVWAGTFGSTKDGLPYIGKHPDFPSSYFVLGFGGNGITFSVIGMDMVSDMLKNQSHPLAKYFAFGR